MPREISGAIRAVLDADWAETHDLIEITLPQMPGDVTPPVLYLASAAIVVGTQLYEPLLRSVGTIKFSLGQAPDNTDLQVDNLEGAYGALLSETDRTLTGAVAVIKRAFLVQESPRVFEVDILMNGYVKDWKVDQEYVRVTIVSDMSISTAQVAKRQLTQRCLWVFKSVECGYVDGQGGTGPFTTCNKVFDSPGGCLGRANQWRFGGIPPLSPNAQVTNVDLIDNGGNNFNGYRAVDLRLDRDWNRGFFQDMNGVF